MDREAAARNPTLTDTPLPPPIDDRISSFSQLLIESSVSSPSSLTQDRLVDHPAYSHTAKLWQILLKFRRRLYADAGVREVFAGLRLRGLDLPTEGEAADEMWGVVARAAVNDEEGFLEVVWGYVQDLDGRTGRAWKGLYDAVVGGLFATDPVKARAWHYKLYPRHASRSLPELFTSVMARAPEAHGHLRIIHAVTARPAGVYTAMIGALCKLGLHREAARWHQHCLSFGDLPESTAAANPLVVWTAAYGTIGELKRLMESFGQTGVRIVESTLVGILISRPDKMEALRFILSRSNAFSTRAMGDRFWAHVVRQRGIDREDVYRYLCTFATGLSVGRQTVEAVTKRFEIEEERSVWLLAEIGVLIREGELQPREPETEPEDNIKSLEARPLPDPNPATMEALYGTLKYYIDSKDWQSFDSLLRRPLPGPPDARLANIVLQSDLSRGRLQEALHRFEQMRLEAMEITTPTKHLLIKTLLRPRKRRYNPDTFPWYLEDDTFLVIGLLFSLLRTNHTHVEPYLWEEIIKRLGMMRRLPDLETLCLGLVEWYHPDRAAATRRKFASSVTMEPLSAEGTVQGLVAPERPTQIPERSRGNPLRKIFTKQFFQGIVEWGFMTFRPYSAETMPYVPPPPPPKTRGLPGVYKEWAGCVPLFTWGVALARKLKDLGVYVDPRVLERGIRVRLAPVFRPSSALETPLRINKIGACLMGYLWLEEIVEAVEKTWGERLWRRKGWANPVHPARRLCECGKERFVVEDGEKQRFEREKKEKAMMEEVLGTAAVEARMLARTRRRWNAGKKEWEKEKAEWERGRGRGMGRGG